MERWNILLLRGGLGSQERGLETKKASWSLEVRSPGITVRINATSAQACSIDYYLFYFAQEMNNIVRSMYLQQLPRPWLQPSPGPCPASTPCSMSCRTLSRLWSMPGMTTASRTALYPCSPASTSWERDSWCLWCAGPRLYQVRFF